ncbi:hypothetical protein D5086_006298 [Populus alba]|uniref:Uncharacterized protein n=1 Tax=Populus alba TaxID=43335 RepID=A0ACC4CLE8_POPAL
MLGESASRPIVIRSDGHYPPTTSASQYQPSSKRFSINLKNIPNPPVSSLFKNGGLVGGVFRATRPVRSHLLGKDSDPTTSEKSERHQARFQIQTLSGPTSSRRHRLV